MKATRLYITNIVFDNDILTYFLRRNFAEIKAFE